MTAEEDDHLHRRELLDHPRDRDELFALLRWEMFEARVHGGFEGSTACAKVDMNV
jgi:hypothetical protein